ncbi:MAG: YceI family protein [Gammaproteobacteria bacterium]|nr:YceI family protein [Gammaproteobacteria bacterium]
MQTLRYLAPLAILGVIGPAQAGSWDVADSSSVGFVGEQQGGKFNGKFATFSASIDFDPTSPTSGSITGRVVTESVDTRDYDRDASLMEPDWFDVENHPEATFESESIEAAADGTFVARGNLTMKGTTKPVDLKFTFEQDGSTATFMGTMAIDRFDFNVGQGWNDTYMVGKDVEVTIDLDLTQ